MFLVTKGYSIAASIAKTATAPMKATPTELKAVMALLLEIVGGALPPGPY